LKISKSLPLIFLLLFPQTALAYVGPGAGFTLVTSFTLFLLTFILALFIILFWPFKWLLRIIFRKKGTKKKCVVIGLDGFDPQLAARYISEGKLPHFQALQEEGTFLPLETTCPAMSPVAWSTFQTGVSPAKHNIFDFLQRDKYTYLPQLSSCRIEPPTKVLKIGNFRIPLSRANISLLRKSKPFWEILGEKNIFSQIIRVPLTFPPQKFSGVMLSGMCVPDLLGTQGSFTHYSTEEGGAKLSGGRRIKLEVKSDGTFSVE